VSETQDDSAGNIGNVGRKNNGIGTQANLPIEEMGKDWMNWESANKKQLLQIAISEDCDIDYKYEAVRELQSRWSQDMLTDVVIMYGKGYMPKEIAEFLGVKAEQIGGIISKYQLRRVGA